MTFKLTEGKNRNKGLKKKRKEQEEPKEEKEQKQQGREEISVFQPNTNEQLQRMQADGTNGLENKDRQTRPCKTRNNASQEQRKAEGRRARRGRAARLLRVLEGRRPWTAPVAARPDLQARLLVQPEAHLVGHPPPAGDRRTLRPCARGTNSDFPSRQRECARDRRGEPEKPRCPWRLLAQLSCSLAEVAEKRQNKIQRKICE